eukprot:COSAG03_NODE_283_length_9462_cov_3.269038_1_plen_193_part_00
MAGSDDTRQRGAAHEERTAARTGRAAVPMLKIDMYHMLPPVRSRVLLVDRGGLPACPAEPARVAPQLQRGGRMACVDEAIAAQEKRIAKLEAPTPPGSPKDGVDAELGTGLDDEGKRLLQAAVDFLREPQVQKAPMSAKINYLHQKLKLGSAGIKVAVGLVYGRAFARAHSCALAEHCSDAVRLCRGRRTHR